MSSRLIIGVVALAGVSICGLVAALINAGMVENVNHRLPRELQFSILGWYWPKRRRLHHEYRKLYPEGNLLWKFRIIVALGFGCLLACAWAVGIFSI